MGQVEKEMEAMREYAEDMFKKDITELQKNIVSITPIDTKKLKNSIIEHGVKGNKDNLTISASNMSDNYSYSIMILGRRAEGGKMVGSLQLPDGVIPYVRGFLQNKNIKFKIMRD